jgi:TolB-like protein
MSFFAELKRRNVIRVGVAYVVTAWLIVQIVDVVLNNIEAPDWIFQVVLLLLAIGFPLVLIIAWAFELTPEGIKKEKDVDRSQSIRAETGRKLNYLTIGVLAMVAVYFFWESRIDRADPDSTAIDQQATQVATTPADPESATAVDKNSIAVLPFVNMSSDPEQEYFSDGITEEIINAVVKIPGLSVPARTSVFGFKGHQGDVRQIGNELNVAYILEGSIRSQANQVRITAQLINVGNGYHLWSETFDRQLDNIFIVQEEIASAIAKVLVGELDFGADTVPNRTVNMKAYDTYLNGRTLLRERRSGMIKELELATQLDPDFIPAWAALALAYQVQGYYTPSGVDLQIKARETAQYVLSIDPQNVDALDALASAERSMFNWAEAEKYFNIALALDPESSELLEDYAEFLCNTARIKECLAVVRRALESDPVFYPLTGFRIFGLLHEGKYQEALATRRQAGRQWGHSWADDDLQVQTELNLDIHLAADDTASAVLDLKQVRPVTGTVTAAIDLLNDPSDKVAMALLTSMDSSAHPNAFWFALSLEGIVPAYLGEAEYIIDRVIEIDGKAQWGDTSYAWGKTWRHVRSHPRFEEVLALYNLPEYWDEAGWPEFCQRTDKGITCQ